MADYESGPDDMFAESPLPVVEPAPSSLEQHSGAYIVVHIQNL